MSEYKLWRDARAARRVPVRFRAKITTDYPGPAEYGECTDLSVSGMTLRTSYVPRPQEEFQVCLVPPKVASGPVQPFSAKVKVVRCHEIERGQCYELGLAILEVLK